MYPCYHCHCQQVDAPEKAQSCVNPAGQQYGCGLISKDALAQKVGSKVRLGWHVQAAAGLYLRHTAVQLQHKQ